MPAPVPVLITWDTPEDDAYLKEVLDGDLTAPTTSHDGAEFRSVAQLARTLGVSPATVRRAIASGELPAIKVRGQLRVGAKDFTGWLSRGRVEPSGQAITERAIARPPARDTAW